MMQDEGEKLADRRDNRQIYFFVFWFVNNVVLWNVFIGQVISISLDYYQQIVKEKLKFNDEIKANQYSQLTAESLQDYSEEESNKQDI